VANLTDGAIYLISSDDDSDSGTIHLELSSSEDDDGIVLDQKKSRINSSSKSSGSSLQWHTSGRDQNQSTEKLLPMKRKEPTPARVEELEAEFREQKRSSHNDPVIRSIVPVSIITYSYFSNYLILTLSLLFISLSTLFSLYTDCFYIFSPFI